MAMRRAGFSRASLAVALAGLVAMPAAPLAAQSTAQVRLSAEQMLDLSQEALARGDAATARRVLETLVSDPKLQVRNEARFRLAMLAVATDDLTRAAVLLRAILDEEPGAQRARLELARVLGMKGDVAGARRELRQAQAGQLPPEVARVVERFSAVLRERKPYGGNLEVALAPDSNINRATRSNTLGTVLGEFDLSEDAQAQSGIGLAARGTGYVRQPLSGAVTLLGQASVDTSLYRKTAFNDVIMRLSTGPEWQLSNGQLRLLGSYQRRWFGGRRYADTMGAGIDWEHALNRTTQLRLSGDLFADDVASNDLQDALNYALSGTIEKALSQRTGASASLSVLRQDARDPGFSTWVAQLGGFAWRELGRTTVIVGAAYSRLAADARIPLYLHRREDESLRLSVAATLRHLTMAGFAPQVRLTWDRNASTVEIYDYSRLRAEIGIVRGF